MLMYCTVQLFFSIKCQYIIYFINYSNYLLPPIVLFCFILVIKDLAKNVLLSFGYEKKE
jgi:ACR3 family arsenite efflux pump ArsB